MCKVIDIEIMLCVLSRLFLSGTCDDKRVYQKPFNALRYLSLVGSIFVSYPVGHMFDCQSDTAGVYLVIDKYL